MRIQLSEHFTYKKLFMFVMPSIVMMVFTSVYSVVDGLFVAKNAGEDAVTAITLIYPLIIVLGSIGFMLGAGGSALVSKTLGEGDKEKANAYFSMLVYVTLGIGIAIAVAGQFAVPAVARLLIVGEYDETVYNYCVIYGRILLMGQPFFILQNIFQSFFVTPEKPRLGLIVTAAAGFLNIALDGALVAGFGLGLRGAAIATVISQLFGGVFPVIYFATKNTSLLRLTKTKFYFKALLKSCTNGSSEFFSNVSSAVVIMLYNFQIQKILGDDLGKAGVAAYGSVMYISMIFFSMFMGFAVGSAPLMGFNYGAQNKEEMRNLNKKSLIINIVGGLLMFALSEALAYPFIKMFGYEQAVFDMALRGFRIYACVFLTAGLSVYASSLFTALNNGLISGLISFSRSIIFQIAAVMILPIFWGIDGVWSAACFAEVASLCISLGCIIGFRKKYGYA